MSVHVKIQCDVCARAGAGGKRARPAVIREDLAREGWKHSHGKDVCPSCGTELAAMLREGEGLRRELERRTAPMKRGFGVERE